jgi:hypothetical protein
MSALPDDDDSRPTADVLRAARQAVDDATRRLDEVTAALAGTRAAADLSEALLDAVLDVVETPVVVVDAGRRLTAVSRAAAAELGCKVGDPLSDLLPADAARRVGGLLDEGQSADVDLPDVGAGVRLQILSSGHAILVLTRSPGGDP